MGYKGPAFYQNSFLLDGSKDFKLKTSLGIRFQPTSICELEPYILCLLQALMSIGLITFVALYKVTFIIPCVKPSKLLSPDLLVVMLILMINSSR